MRAMVIAEAGVNHNGDVALAEELIRAAADAGADYVKFQTFIPELAVSKRAAKAKYQQDATGAGESQLDMVRKLALGFDDFRHLKRVCEREGIRFLSTPFDSASIDFLCELGVDFWKIPSGEITNYPYLAKVGSTGAPIVLSTGMSELEEVREAVKLLEQSGCGPITVLQCNTQYPTPFADANLRGMLTLGNALDLPYGYSDHTLGIEVPIAAVAMGACVIEKHFTLDRSMQGPDHSASLEPMELAAMIAAIRNVELALGDGQKKVSPSERENAAVARKSIVASRAITKGEILTEENLTVKRPGTGISPMRWPEILGARANRDYEEDELIVL